MVESEVCINALKEHDVLLLSETWTGKDSSFSIDGFEIMNFYSKHKHRKAKRNNGGICILLRKAIRKGVTVIKNYYDTLIW